MEENKNTKEIHNNLTAQAQSYNINSSLNSDAKNTMTYQFTEIAVRSLENQISIIKELEDIKSVMTKELTETPLDEKDFAVNGCLEKYIQRISELFKQVGGDIDEDL